MSLPFEYEPVASLREVRRSNGNISKSDRHVGVEEWSGVVGFVAQGLDTLPEDLVRYQLCQQSPPEVTLREIRSLFTK